MVVCGPVFVSVLLCVRGAIPFCVERVLRVVLSGIAVSCQPCVVLAYYAMRAHPVHYLFITNGYSLRLCLSIAWGLHQWVDHSVTYVESADTMSPESHRCSLRSLRRFSPEYVTFDLCYDCVDNVLTTRHNGHLFSNRPTRNGERKKGLTGLRNTVRWQPSNTETLTP